MRTAIAETEDGTLSRWEGTFWGRGREAEAAEEGGLLGLFDALPEGAVGAAFFCIGGGVEAVVFDCGGAHRGWWCWCFAVWVGLLVCFVVSGGKVGWVVVCGGRKWKWV